MSRCFLSNYGHSTDAGLLILDRCVELHSYHPEMRLYNPKPYRAFHHRIFISAYVNLWGWGGMKWIHWASVPHMDVLCVPVHSSYIARRTRITWVQYRLRLIEPTMESFTTTLDFGLRLTVPPKADEVKSSGRRSIGARTRNYRPCTICKRRKTRCEMIEGQGKCKFCLRKGIKCVVEDIHECSSSPSETEISGTDVHPPHPDNTDAHDDYTLSTPSPQDIGYADVLSTATYPVHLGQGLSNQEPSAVQTYCEGRDDMLGLTTLDVICTHDFGENGCGQHHAAVDSVIALQTFLETEPRSFGPTTIPNLYDDLMDEEIAHHSAVQQQFSLDSPQDSRTPHTGDSSTIYEETPASACLRSRPEVENKYAGAYSPVSSDGSTSSSQESPPSTPIGPTYLSDQDWMMYFRDNEYLYIANIELRLMNGQLILTHDESRALFRRAVLLISHLGDPIGCMSHFVHSEGDKFFYGRRDYDLKGDPIGDTLYLSRVNGELSGALFWVHCDRSLMGSTADAVVDIQYPA